MSKERFLTVMVPIKDSDCEAAVYASLEALQSDVPASASNIDKIYKIEDGSYYRSKKIGNSYSYSEVTDREFPFLGDALNIYNFTYDATRMGPSPTISAQGVMRYAEKDGEGEDITLEDLWTQECHVVFNGEKFYLKGIPTSSKSAEDARYRYDIEFLSERSVLEHVYIYDVVSPFLTERPLSQESKFSFFGDIKSLADRINASLIRSGLAQLTRKYVGYPNHPDYTVQYLTYEQWNMVGVNPSSLAPSVFVNVTQAMEFRSTIYEVLAGNYNSYLMEYIFVNENGVFDTTGYKVVIGKDKTGQDATSEEHVVTFEDNTIHEALQQFHDTFGFDYYVAKEKDSNGFYTGNTIITVGDCEHDFADWIAEAGDYARDQQGIPTTSNPIDYGVTKELLSKEKTNVTEKIVNRITGVGSSENIPWHYPNPTPDGWIQPVYKRGGEVQNGIDIDYPTSEGSSASDYARYEKYIKNRLGVPIKCGVLKNLIIESDESQGSGSPSAVLGEDITQTFSFNTDNIVLPTMTLDLNYNAYESGCTKFTAELFDVTSGEMIATYDSSETYTTPNQFQTMCANHDGEDTYLLVPFHTYSVRFKYHVPTRPYSKKFDYEGYLHTNRTIEYVSSHYAYVGQNFYSINGLTPFVDWDVLNQSVLVVHDTGYSVNGNPDGKVAPILRLKDKQYKHITDGTIYRCATSETVNVNTGLNSVAYEANPKMSREEWKNTFLYMRMRIFEASGWYINDKLVNLSDYGLGAPSSDGSAISPQLFDTIEFQRVKYLTPQSFLMPELYVKTDGERRFYNAHNYYPLQVGTPDEAVGERQVGQYVNNPIYKQNENDPDIYHYRFENEYSPSFPFEHIEKMEDEKPTIKGQTNTVNGVSLRIDVVEEFAYDETDNNEIWESNENGSVRGEYKHPYFFAKLRPLGFNIFDLALQEDMVLSFTTGSCGACNFKIGVDENTKKNPLQIWQYDVYGGETYENKGEKIYSAGDLRRYVDLNGLYYNTSDSQSGYLPVKSFINTTGGESIGNGMYSGYSYSEVEVAEGYVGTVNTKGNPAHFEGDVVTNGRYIQELQDTSENYVWVALMKDTDTYGTLMPSAIPNYKDPSFNVYMRPKSIADVHDSGSTAAADEGNADKFVILNIRLPQIYIRRAEHNLSRKLVKYMYENNYQKFNFSVKFSRIFLEQNRDTDVLLNENSVIYVLFNGATYRQYVKHYTYKVSESESLPEINVETNQELPVSLAFMRKQEMVRQRTNTLFSAQMNLLDKKIKESGKGGVVINATSTSTSTSKTNIYSLEWEEF